MMTIQKLEYRIHTAWVLGYVLLFMIVQVQPAVAADPQYNQFRAIPKVLVYADPDATGQAENNYAIIVDKARQQIGLYNHERYWKKVAKWRCSTGRQKGPKEREGDQKTPEGVYFATRNVGQKFLTETYGSRALPLDYPNLVDRRLARGGSAIWLHGTNKPLLSRDSNGCVVIENDTVDQLSNHISLNRTPVIIVDKTKYWTVKAASETADRMLSAADQWHHSLMFGNYQEYCRTYNQDHRPTMRWWQQWCRQRRQRGQKPGFASVLSRRAIYRSDGYFVLLADHHLKLPNRNIWAGRRKLFFAVEEEKLSIVAAEYQAAPTAAEDPLFYAWRKLWQKRQQRSNMAGVRKNDRGM